MSDFINLNIEIYVPDTTTVLDTNYIPSNHNISLKHSKLIPYCIWRIFNRCLSTDIPSFNIPTSNVNTYRITTASIKYYLSEINTFNETRSNYVNVKIGAIRLPIFIRNHMIYTYDITSINELNSANVDLKPIILLALCNGRDQELYKEFNIETSVLVVNSDPAIQHLMRPFNRYIKEYKENGVKNVLYTQNPNYYILNNSVEKAPLMTKVKMNTYIEEFLPDSITNL